MYKGNHKKGEIEIVEEHLVFRNKFACLYNDDVIFPSGTRGKYLRFEWTAPYGIMVLPQDRDGNILLIHNFRHETRRWSWDIPKGFGEIDLSPEECAQKELLEETRYTGTDWSLYKKITDKGKTTYLFNVVVEEQANVSLVEVGEAIEQARFFSKAELAELLLSDKINDPMTMFFIAKTLAFD